MYGQDQLFNIIPMNSKQLPVSAESCPCHDCMVVNVVFESFEYVSILISDVSCKLLLLSTILTRNMFCKRLGLINVHGLILLFKYALNPVVKSGII